MQLPESAVQDLFGCKSGLELMGIGCISQVTAAAVDGITCHTVLDSVCYAEGPPFPQHKVAIQLSGSFRKDESGSHFHNACHRPQRSASCSCNRVHCQLSLLSCW